MAKNALTATTQSPPTRRRFSDEFRRDAVQMLLNGQSTVEVAERLGLSGPNLLGRCRALHFQQVGPVATALDDRVRPLEAELLHVTRERDMRIKCVGHFRPIRATDVYAAVESIVADGGASLATVCDVLGVCRPAYHSWQMAEPGVRQRELDELTPTIVAIFVKHRRRYGARRIAHELRDCGIVCSPRRVARVLLSKAFARSSRDRSYHAPPRVAMPGATARNSCSIARTRLGSMNCGSGASPI